MSAPRYTFSPKLHQSDAPFSHFAQVGDLGFVSGLIGQRPEDGRLVSSDTQEQCEAMFDNLSTLLADVGTDVGRLLRTNLYLGRV